MKQIKEIKFDKEFIFIEMKNGDKILVKEKALIEILLKEASKFN